MSTRMRRTISDDSDGHIDNCFFCRRDIQSCQRNTKEINIGRLTTLVTEGRCHAKTRVNLAAGLRSTTSPKPGFLSRRVPRKPSHYACTFPLGNGQYEEVSRYRKASRRQSESYSRPLSDVRNRVTPATKIGYPLGDRICRSNWRFMDRVAYPRLHLHSRSA